MMRRALLPSLLMATGCVTEQPPQQASGWTVDPTYHASTTVQVFLYGPASDVDAVIADGRQFGWSLVERSVLASGSALALVGGSGRSKARRLYRPHSWKPKHHNGTGTEAGGPANSSIALNVHFRPIADIGWLSTP